MAECGLPQTPCPPPYPRPAQAHEACPRASPTVAWPIQSAANWVPEEDMEWDIEGLDGDPMEGSGHPRGSVRQSRRQREEEEYMEGVRRGVLAGAHVEELRRSCLGIDVEMDMVAVGTHGGRQ